MKNKRRGSDERMEDAAADLSEEAGNHAVPLFADNGSPHRSNNNNNNNNKPNNGTSHRNYIAAMLPSFHNDNNATTTNNNPMQDTSLKSIDSIVTEQALTEDIYSLMTVQSVFSLSFWYAAFIFIVQCSILVLVLIDLVDFSTNPVESNSKTNRMNIPVDAHMTVRVAQFLGIILIVNFAAADGDLMKGFSHVLHGFNPAIVDECPDASRSKWYMAGVLQGLVGVVLTIDLFILLMQSTTNIGLCLNFAALHFVQDIDDVAFTMGTMGFITKRVQKQCLRVGDLTIQTKKKQKKDWMRRMFVYLLTIGLYIPYFIVTSWQWTGHFMCKSVYVQFGDLYGVQWPYYSGLFQTPGTSLSDRTEGRAVYLSDLNLSDAVRLAYCGKERAWTFSHVTETDQCNYFIKSTSTESFDIMDIAASPWFAKTADLGDVPMEWLVLTCSDCNENLCSPSVGQCINNECICSGDRLGLSCEFETANICPVLGLDRRSKGDIATLAFANLFVRKQYTRLENSKGADTMYDRPIYVSQDLLRNVDLIIVFTGYRWIIYGVPQEETSVLGVGDFLEYLEANDPVRRPLQTLKNISSGALPFFRPILFSFPNRFGTESHDVDPSTASWLLADSDDSLDLVGASPSLNQRVPARFLCSQCNNRTQPCLNDGVCQEDNQCSCLDPANNYTSYGGFACEYAYTCTDRDCQNGGTCDPIFDVCEDCNPGYYGNLCQFKRKNWAEYEKEIAINPSGMVDANFLCDNTTCLNDGYCTSNIEPCVCPEDYDGDFCAVHLHNSSLTDGIHFQYNGTCLNGGFFSNLTDGCACPEPYFGNQCESVGHDEEFISETEYNETSSVSNSSSPKAIEVEEEDNDDEQSLSFMQNLVGGRQENAGG